MHGQTTHERFWSKVDRSAGPEACWPWTASIHKKGYGRFGLDGMKPAHRVAYILTHGPVPEGLVVDHLCFNRRCVNPLHLQTITPAENSRRRERAGLCRRGHRIEGENVRLDRGKPRCRTCANEGKRRRRTAVQEQTEAESRAYAEALERWRAGEAEMPAWLSEEFALLRQIDLDRSAR